MRNEQYLISSLRSLRLCVKIFRNLLCSTDIEVNINIMRAFVQLRRYVLSKSDTNEQIAELRKLLMLYIEKNDKRVNEIIISLNNLIEQPPKTKKIGFNAE